MSRMFHTNCNCLHFNWRTGLTTIALVTETIQLAISFICILILKCLKTHIDNVRKRRGGREDPSLTKMTMSNSITIEAINELKGKTHINFNNIYTHVHRELLH